MPSATPIRTLPYPLDADPIDVAGDIQRLAERLDIDGGRTPAKVFTSKAALDAGTVGWPEGSLAMVAPGVLYAQVAGTWRVYESLPVQQQNVLISGTNVGQGVTVLQGQFTMLQSTVNRFWNVVWTYGLSGHTVSSTYRTRIYRLVDGAVMAVSGYGTYHANEPMTGNHLSSFHKAANTGNEGMGFALEIDAAFGNTHINGGAMVLGVATEA